MDVLKCKLTAWATRSATVGISGGPGSTIVLWYVHPSHRRRKVAARRQPIADSRAYRGCGAKSGWGCTHWKAPPCHGEYTPRIALEIPIESASYGSKPRTMSKNWPIWLRTEKE